MKREPNYPMDNISPTPDAAESLLNKIARVFAELDQEGLNTKKISNDEALKVAAMLSEDSGRLNSLIASTDLVKLANGGRFYRSLQKLHAG